MSWLISRALMEAYENLPSSRDLVGEFLAESCSDGKPFALLNSKPIPQAYLHSDRMTNFSRLSRFGMTFAPLTEDRGKELLTWFLAGFPVKTSAQPEKARESRATDPASGWKWRESSMKYDQDSRSWKTRQSSLLGDWEEFSETWPRWGSMRDGECWGHAMLDTITDGKESGLLPTVTVCGNYNRVGVSETSGDGVATVWKQLTGSFPSAENLEVLMGVPAGWTDLRPSATDKYRNAPPKHGEFLQTMSGERGA